MAWYIDITCDRPITRAMIRAFDKSRDKNSSVPMFFAASGIVVGDPIGSSRRVNMSGSFAGSGHKALPAMKDFIFWLSARNIKAHASSRDFEIPEEYR